MNRDYPLWALSVNAIGKALGGFGSMIDLSERALVEASGLTHGSNHMKLLSRCLIEEAGLHTVGALMARAELMRAIIFAQRLSDSAMLETHPNAVETKRAIFIVGLARSGTSLLQRLLSNSYGIFSPKTYQVIHPDSLNNSARASLEESVGLQDKLWDLLDPDFPSIHHNSAELPAECLPVQAASMLSHHWTGCYRLPTYDAYLNGIQTDEPFRLHREFFKVLLLRNPGNLILFKSPAYARQLQSITEAYPDAKFILIVRPLQAALSSHVRLLKSIRSMRMYISSTQQVELQDAAHYFEDAMNIIISLLADGSLNSKNLIVLNLQTLLERPRSVIDDLRRWLGVATKDGSDEQHINVSIEELSKRLEQAPTKKTDLVQVPRRLQSLFYDLTAALDERGCLYD